MKDIPRSNVDIAPKSLLKTDNFKATTKENKKINSAKVAISNHQRK